MVPIPIGSATSIKSELERHVLLLLYIKELLGRYQMLIHFSSLKWDKNLETVYLITPCCVLDLCPESSLGFCGVTRTLNVVSMHNELHCVLIYCSSCYSISTYSSCLAGCNLTFPAPKPQTQAFPGDMHKHFWSKQTTGRFYIEWHWEKLLHFQLCYPRILQCGYIYISSKKISGYLAPGKMQGGTTGSRKPLK